MKKIITILGLIAFLVIGASSAFCAIDAGTTWEIQTGGYTTNGGGFYDRDPGTSVDYSQQTSAQLNPTDLAMTQSATTLTSATGGFTAAMAGNIIQIISGTNFDTGFYEITAYTDTNTVTLDRTAASGGNGSSGEGNVGGCLKHPEDFGINNDAAYVAGNTIYIKNGTYTWTQNIVNTNSDATLANGIKIIGYNSTRGDDPIDDNRPLLAMGAYYWTVGEHHLLKCCRITNSGEYNYRPDKYGKIFYCKFTNSSGTATHAAINLDGGNGHHRIFYCEATHSGGYVVNPESPVGSAYCYNYFHDGTYGVILANTDDDNFWYGNIFDTLTHGIVQNTSFINGVFLNNTIYLCSSIGVWGVGSNGASIFINNLIDSNGTGASYDSAASTEYWDYNNWYNNSTDVTNVTKGSNATAQNPSFTDAANADFSTGTNVQSTGEPGDYGGTTTSYSCQGAVQSDINSAGSSGVGVL